MSAIEPAQSSADSALSEQRFRAPKAMLGTFKGNKFAVGSLIVLILIILFCFLGPSLYHTNQVSARLLLENQPPSSKHLLGTSPTGRDELGRLMYGGQSTIELGFAVGLLASAFGLIWGTTSGFVGGVVDSIMMRIVDALLSIPFLFFVILLASIIRPTLGLIIIVISGVSWLSTARLVRGETLRLKSRDFVVAASGFGAPRWRLIARHILPNVIGVLVVNATLKIADAILTFAALGYLGLGIPPPATNWGEILAGGVNNIFDGYWWQLWPAAVLIVVTVLAVNVLGDALQDVVEARV